MRHFLFKLVEFDSPFPPVYELRDGVSVEEASEMTVKDHPEVDEVILVKELEEYPTCSC